MCTFVSAISMASQLDSENHVIDISVILVQDKLCKCHLHKKLNSPVHLFLFSKIHVIIIKLIMKYNIVHNQLIFLALGLNPLFSWYASKSSRLISPCLCTIVHMIKYIHSLIKLVEILTPSTCRKPTIQRKHVTMHLKQPPRLLSKYHCGGLICRL